MIFITGMMRSGTTAIQKIFSYYVACEYTADSLKISGDIQRGQKCPNIRFLKSDKNYGYYNFTDELYRQLDAKIIYIIRDGKKVVRSIMDWDARFDREPYYKHSMNNYARINKYDDPFKNAIYYYKKYNEIGLKKLEKIPKSHKYILDMEKVTPIEIKKIYDKFNLKGYDELRVKTILEGKVNSRKSRFGMEDEFPQPENWTKEMNEIYDSIIP